MARKFTRKRWRRPERMTLEHPPVMRRKDIGAPTQLTLEPDIARRASRRRLELLLVVFLALCAIEGVVIAVATGRWILVPIVTGVGILYFFIAREWGDAWLRRALRTSTDVPERLRRLATAEARTAGLPEPEILLGPGAEPNALALALRKRTIIVTRGSEAVDELVLEGVFAHEVIHLRDGEATVAALYLVLAAAPQLLLRGAGLGCLLALPLWPVCACLRIARHLASPPNGEHRADVGAALLTRYPPGVVQALRLAGGRTCGLGAADGFWFVPRNAARDEAPQRAALVAEM